MTWIDALRTPWWQDPVQREKAAAFAAAYAARSGLPPDWLAEYGRYAEPCDPSRCGDEECESWQMGYPWEDAITEDQQRNTDWDAPPEDPEDLERAVRWFSPEEEYVRLLAEETRGRLVAMSAAGSVYTSPPVEYGPLYGFSVRSTNGFMDAMETFKKMTDIVAEVLAREIVADFVDVLRDWAKTAAAIEAKHEARRHRTKFQRKRPRW
jgi:hypothetical protein